jgi:hypothetical protein
MEPLTINQELYNLSLADLIILYRWIDDTDIGDEIDMKLSELVFNEINSRIDLIKSKI